MIPAVSTHRGGLAPEKQCFRTQEGDSARLDLFEWMPAIFTHKKPHSGLPF